MGIAQKVVIITGASQGMGAALVEACAVDETAERPAERRVIPKKILPI
jgi:NAD(P)-dependent dehydrogenase (short-subunit alcohol dehydrogenase family)